MASRTERPLPLARTEGLVVQELPDEVLMYDLHAHKVHCLNRTSAAVWKRCDGKTTATEAARLLKRELKEPFDENVVWLAVSQLDKFRLFEERARVPAPPVGMNRREMVRKLGLAAAISLPLITSMVAPTAAQAQSATTCVEAGGACTSTVQCCGRAVCCGETCCAGECVENNCVGGA